MRKYPYLRAWNVFMHSPSSYNVELAYETNAPHDAIYYDVDGKWHTFGEIKSSDTKAQIEELVVRFK